jgi:5-methylcytosine-specific restriction endonuclease McrA
MDEQASEWAQLYAEYLKSEEWALRRARVMERAHYRCEGCRERNAIDVHHLSYAHITQEFLFELVALCRECHERWHEQTDKPSRPEAANWTPRHTNRAPAPKGETPAARDMRTRLSQLAAVHRAKTMAKPNDEPETAA